LKKYFILLIAVFIFGCNNADDVQYEAKLKELQKQEKALNRVLDEQQKVIDLKQQKRLQQFIQLGGTEEEFKQQLEREQSMSTEEIIESTNALKKQIEDQNKILSSLREEASKTK